MADMVQAVDSLNEAMRLVDAIWIAAASLGKTKEKDAIQFVADLAFDKAEEAKKLLNRRLAEERGETISDEEGEA